MCTYVPIKNGSRVSSTHFDYTTMCVGPGDTSVVFLYLKGKKMRWFIIKKKKKINDVYNLLANR